MIQLLTSRILPIADFHILVGVHVLMAKQHLAQGLANIAPEHKKDMDELRKQFPIEELLWGGYLQITFPGL